MTDTDRKDSTPGTIGGMTVVGLVVGVAFGLSIAAVGCADSAEEEPRIVDEGGSGTTGGGSTGGGSTVGGTTGGTGGGTGGPPEQEEEFEFSRPAVVGEHIFVANETLNSMAVIDSRSLSIVTEPVGFQPTEVVGPQPEHSGEESARVMVLNEGSGSVSVVNPTTFETTTRTVMRQANAIAMDPTGRRALTWFDDTDVTATSKAGDLSSVSVVTPGTTHQVSVGFHVREVHFDRSGQTALVMTDDGVSPVEFEDLEGDSVAPPVPLVPPALADIEPDALEVQVTADGEYVLTRSRQLRGVVLLEIDSGTHHVVPLPEVPTDLDLIPDAQTPEAMLMLRESDRLIRADIPEGFVNAAAALASKADDIRLPEEGQSDGAGSDSDAGSMESRRGMLGPDASMTDAGTDTGVADTGVADTGVADTGVADTGVADTGVADTGADTGTADTGVADSGPADSGTDDTGATDTGATDTGATDTGSDTGQPADFFPPIDNFEVVDVTVPDMGSAAIGESAEHALLFTTVGDEKRVVLYALEETNAGDEQRQRAIALEKRVRGAISDRRGATFIVYNAKQPGPIPEDATPADPEFVARSWGMTLIDVETAASRLILTREKPGPTALWSPDAGAENGTPRIFMHFEIPNSAAARQDNAALRDIVEANLETFRTTTHRVPSLPTGMGPIAEAGKIFVNQAHPQGRMTFIDVATGERQTITGYQLNAGID